MKQNLKDAGFDVEYDAENTYEYKAPEYNTDYKFDSESGLLLQKFIENNMFF